MIKEGSPKLSTTDWVDNQQNQNTLPTKLDMQEEEHTDRDLNEKESADKDLQPDTVQNPPFLEMPRSRVEV